jgi:hypothetical protein
MANERATVMVTAKLARSIETLKEYSNLSGIPLDDLLEECFTEYIKSTVETSKS